VWMDPVIAHEMMTFDPIASSQPHDFDH
jgi:hypothetical protein